MRLYNFPDRKIGDENAFMCYQSFNFRCNFQIAKHVTKNAFQKHYFAICFNRFLDLSAICEPIELKNELVTILVVKDSILKHILLTFPVFFQNATIYLQSCSCVIIII